MARQAQPIVLSSNDTRSLKTLLSRGTASARTLSRARILDLQLLGDCEEISRRFFLEIVKLDVFEL